MFNSEENISKTSEYFLNTPSETAKSLFLYPTVLGQFNYSAGYHLERTHFDSFLLIFIRKGNMEIVLNGKKYLASDNDVVLINCYEAHEYSALTDSSTLWLHFDGCSSKAYFDYITGKFSPVIHPSNFNLMYKQLLGIYDKFKSSDTLDEADISLTILSILQEIIVSSKAEAPVSDAVKKAAAYISDNFKNKISIEMISSEAGFSPYYFIRIFKKEIGMTPHQYLLSTRIAAARYSLSTTKMSVSEIAAACGFDDDSAFCYAFKKWEGVTPSEYRNR
ncbi:MAG: AraC family transcriptional regulator [Butyrivibrio sp.]|nr:AraC family transcriptional regulator [Butyrivibrio sp.]